MNKDGMNVGPSTQDETFCILYSLPIQLCALGAI